MADLLPLKEEVPEQKAEQAQDSHDLDGDALGALPGGSSEVSDGRDSTRLGRIGGARLALSEAARGIACQGGHLGLDVGSLVFQALVSRSRGRLDGVDGRLG